MTSQAIRRRYAIVGTGIRAMMYVDAICGPYADSCQLVGLCDLSAVRMRFQNERIAHKYGLDARPVYAAERFEEMIRETRPDTVIVTTVDGFHHDYIARAMRAGCDVLTEKPMTTTAAKAQVIFDAIAETGRSLRVGFNYRYAPSFTALHQIVAEGRIGTPQLVDFSWMLDTSHGADYFRRWHREKENSGGLLVHKASHHFDLANWWISSWPEEIFGMGGLRFYGRSNAEARGEGRPYERYTGVAEAAGDPFGFDMSWSRILRGLYLDAEEETGYLRDRNVMGEPITIEDTMAVTARYRSGALLSYSLVAYSPWEGLRVAITGDRGRVELYETHGAHVLPAHEGPADDADGREALTAYRTPISSVRLFPMFHPPEDIPIDSVDGDHGGGDTIMLEQLFSPEPPPDPHGWAASHLDGAASLLIGVGANLSMETGRPVRADEILKLPPHP